MNIDDLPGYAKHLAVEMGASKTTIDFCEWMVELCQETFPDVSILFTEVRKALINLQQEAEP